VILPPSDDPDAPQCCKQKSENTEACEWGPLPEKPERPEKPEKPEKPEDPEDPEEPPTDGDDAGEKPSLGKPPRGGKRGKRGRGGRGKRNGRKLQDEDEPEKPTEGCFAANFEEVKSCKGLEEADCVSPCAIVDIPTKDGTKAKCVHEDLVDNFEARIACKEAGQKKIRKCPKEDDEE